VSSYCRPMSTKSSSWLRRALGVLRPVELLAKTQAVAGTWRCLRGLSHGPNEAGGAGISAQVVDVLCSFKLRSGAEETYSFPEALREDRMLPKRKVSERKSIATTLMRDIQGSAADKLVMFQKMRAAGGFANEDPAELAKAEEILRTFAAMEKGVE